jgi:predicted amidohydrolase
MLHMTQPRLLIAAVCVFCAGFVLCPAAAIADEGAQPLQQTGESPNTVRVAGIVIKWVRGDKDANYRRVEPKIREAAANGAKIVCTTECFLDGYAIHNKSIPLDVYRALGEPIPGGKYFRRLTALADDLNIYLVAAIHEAAGDKRYNTAALIGPDGKLVGKYHKQVLGHEAVRNTAGNQSPVFETAYGRLGMMICSDRGSQELVKRICDNGADFLICPSGGSFGPRRNDPVLQARSRENKIHIVFVHPAEFLVTAPDGSIRQREVLEDPKLRGKALVIAKEKTGGDTDKNGIFYFNLPVPAKAKSSNQ